ncbi:hypothetical protein DMB37_36945 [Nocardia sp. CS682]|nr:hypothetical protein DMB37_36945 [Nocardia sp. CS682]
MPGMAVYAAAKAFVPSFTGALWAEAHDSRLRVLCLSPGPPSSEFYRVSGTSDQGFRFQTPEQVVDTAFRALRTDCPTVVSGRINALAAVLMHSLPRRLALALTARVQLAELSALTGFGCFGRGFGPVWCSGDRCPAAMT